MPSAAIHVVESTPLRYLLSLPEPADGQARSGNRKASARHPVLCFLHGYDEAAPVSIRTALTLHGPLQANRPALVQEHFIVVAPQLPHPGDLWHRYAEPVLEIAEQVCSEHGGDRARCYLCGFSFGGNGVFDLALQQPDTWAALWAVDPTRVPRRDPQRPVWLSIGEVARFQRQAFITSLQLQDANLGAKGDRIELDQDEDHVGSARLAFGDERIYRWLLDRRLGV